jgi:hypothetical protein
MKRDPEATNGAANSPGSTEAGYVEKFPPTGGRVLGVIAVGMSLATMVYALVDGKGGVEAPVAWGAAFVAVLSYAAFLRPAVRADADALVLRNMLDTNVIPLAAVDQVAVRQVLAVRTEEKRYVSPAIGSSFMRTVRPRTTRDGQRELTYPDYVRDRILHLSDGARRRLGDAEPPPVVRRWAWPEIAALVVTFVGTVVTMLAR